jgi:hypothetical protein
VKLEIEVHGQPCTLVAVAHVHLAGDEKVEVPLTVGRNRFGMPMLEMDFDAVATVLLDRELLS